ncbi:hypothetical protein CRUP_011924 [Coryphaenoides rupestris]|nr:hypothetical protein CRUP_011924 [Coryphaenoides rupestris]
MKDYFYKPPINKLSHTFLDRSLGVCLPVESQASVQTFTSPIFSSFLDMLLCCWVFLALSLACFLQPLMASRQQGGQQGPAAAALPLGLTAALALLELLALLMAIRCLKTYLISGRKADLQPPVCSCCCQTEVGLGGPEPGAAPASASPRNHSPEGGPAARSLPPEQAPTQQQQQQQQHRPPCHLPPWWGPPRRQPGARGSGLSPSPAAQNGLLSPRAAPLTNSQTSLCEMLQEKEKKETWCVGGGAVGAMGAGMDHAALIPLRSKNFRQRSDAHFVDVIKEDSLMKDYFYKPPINKLSHTFLDRSLESAYRCSYQKEVESQASVQTFTSPIFSSFLDMLLCCWVFLALSLACFLQPLMASRQQGGQQGGQQGPPAAAALPLGLTAALALLELLALLMAIRSDGQTNNSSSSSSNVSVGMMDSSSGPRPRDLLGPEACVAFSLLLLLVWFLNREFEVGYRLHYHGNVEADRHRVKIQNMRDQADWLLRNIIPIHVAEQLKVTQSYSKNHNDAGVIFASIVNFGEFYEESYEGGKECYRVLNELIGDFDELLRRPAFGDIEKIKTIGASYMAASGLGAPQQLQQQQQQGGGSDAAHPHVHLKALFEFALEMMRVVDDFNKNMLGFGFKLRVGFNHGPLTAGVIGTTKLLYDIWGDTVNIASRMDTTGVECRVQVSEESYGVLRGMAYDFDYRGTVNVKGKGQMKTFLYPKGGESGGPVPQYQLSVSPEIRAQVDGSIGRSPTDEIASVVPAVAAVGLSANPITISAADRLEYRQRADSHGSLARTSAPLPL